MRTTTSGLEVGTFIKVSNASSRKHGKGTVTRVFNPILDHDLTVEYRSDYDNSLRLAKLADVHIPRKKKYNGKTTAA